MRPNKGILREARALYNQMVSQAKLSAQRDHEAARRRSPIVKALLAACFFAGVLAAITLIYGLITFPDAPIRESTSGYVGKQGAPHTREDFDQYKLWEKLVAGSFGLTLLTGFGAVASEKMSRRGGR
jgi:hypothetical protein